MPMDVDINVAAIGPCTVEFVNGNVLVIDVERHVVDTKGFPVWLDAKDGSRYHWLNIISIKKVG